MELDLAIINKILIIGASYGIVQILALDLGIKTSKIQRDLIKNIPIQIFLFYCGAYAVSKDYILSFITVTLYFILKYGFKNV